MNILTINLALSTLVFWIAARLYVLPKLQDYEARAILLPILLLHSLRHLGRPLRDRRKAVFLSHSHRPGCPLLTQSGHQLQYVPNSFKCDILIRPAADMRGREPITLLGGAAATWPIAAPRAASVAKAPRGRAHEYRDGASVGPGTGTGSATTDLERGYQPPDRYPQQRRRQEKRT